MFSRRFAVVAAFGLVFSPALRAGHRLGAEQQAQVSAWLASHPEYRLATDKDCACDEDLHTMRTTGYGGKWKPVPDYHPYVANGDFNGDGKLDLAVAVIQVTIPHKFTILVFNGPIQSRPQDPAFIEEDANLTGIGFFFGPPRPKPYRLVVGAFESEGYILVPRGRTYRLDPVSTEDE